MITWAIINRRHCSFKIKTDSQFFCRNEYNVTGLCMRKACPLANSQYATVKEERGKIYLYMRYAENVYTPIKEWKKIRLDKKFVTALQQIEDNMVFWPKYYKSKCRQRFLKITQYLARMRKMKLNTTKKLIPIKQKEERNLVRKEEKALIAAKLDNEIEKQLLNRLKEGTYERIYNFPKQTFETLLEDEMEEEEELENELEELEDERAGKKKIKLTMNYDDDEELEDEELTDAKMSEELDRKLVKMSRENDGSDSDDMSDLDLEIEDEVDIEEDEEDFEEDEEAVQYVADFDESEDEDNDIEDVAEKLPRKPQPSTSEGGGSKRKRLSIGGNASGTKWEKIAHEMETNMKYNPEKVYSRNEIMKVKRNQQKEKIREWAKNYEKQQEKAKKRLKVRR